ncbi:MAG: hypothetical protein U5K69_04670 [Balneolaceae bacterium]|nr:hypothetical protein [Balneolaceae bacterium]
MIAVFTVLVREFLPPHFADAWREPGANHGVLLICLPRRCSTILVFGGFLWLVTRHPDKIYGPSDFKNEENFLKMKMKMSAVGLYSAVASSQAAQR